MKTKEPALVKTSVMGAFFLCLVVMQAGAAGGLTAGESTRFNPDPPSAAMGDNIMSLSNTASALFTNPAAMADVLQPKLSFSSLLLNEGMNFSFAGIAYPTRHGTFGGGVARLNYGDINAYDMNGNASSVSASADTQFILSYAVSFKKDMPVTEEMCSIGVAFKMLNSALADYSASGMAIDFGGTYQLPFCYGLSIGAVYRNMGSSLKYVQKSYALPSSLSAGLRYERPELGNLAVAGDVTTASGGSSAAYSMGVSASPVYPLTVQLGWRDEDDALSSGLRGGIGLDFNDFSLHYTLIPFKDYSVIQNVGLDISFGSILQPKYAYDHYLRYHYEQAKQNYKKKDFIIARQQLEEILSMYPDHQASKELLEKIGEAIDAQEQQKTSELSKWLRKADVALSKNNIVSARRYYGYVLGVDPENREANDGVKRIDVLVEKSQRQRAINENRNKLVRLWDDATAYYRKGEYVNAKEKFQNLLAIDPDNAKARQFMDEIDGKLQKISALQINELYLQGKQFYDAGNYREAMRYFGAVVTADHSRADAQDYYNLCQSVLNAESRTAGSARALQQQGKAKEELEAAYNRAVNCYENGDYDESLKLFGKCRDLAQKNGQEKYAENARHYITTIKGLLAEHNYKVGYDYFQKNKLEQAAAKYRKALEYNPDYVSAKTELDRISDTLAQQLYEQGMKEFANGNQDKAKELFKKSLTYKSDKPEALRALERIR
jgi:tetratricopeptide (TPR) repeat protein